MFTHELELAWAAGLYEGEGSVSLLYGKNRTRAIVQFSLTSTDKDVVAKFHRIVGIGSYRGPYVKKPGRKPSWTWTANGWINAGIILREFGPYLGERRRARLLSVLSQNPGPPQRRANHSRRKITFEQAQAIRERLKEGAKKTHLAKEYGIAAAQIWRIEVGHTYLH